MGAGTVQGVCVQNVRRLALGEPVTRTMDYQGTLALDGEREIFFQPGDEITCRVTRNGPLRVDADCSEEELAAFCGDVEKFLIK